MVVLSTVLKKESIKIKLAKEKIISGVKATDFPPSHKVLKENYGKPIEVSSEESMNYKLEDKNVGKIYKYTGESTDTFTNGEYYTVVDE